MTGLATDIILIRPADRSMLLFKKIGAVQHPMNLVYLATWLREIGHNPEIYDLEVDSFVNLEKKLKNQPPHLVGITATTANISEARRICVLARSLGIKTVMGGPHATVLPVETIKDTGCDYVVLGEGEKPLGDLLDRIKDEGGIDNIEGLAFFKNGVPIVNQRARLIDIDELPIPDRRFLNLELYSGETTPGILGKGATIFTSRGCPYKCTFCASRIINSGTVRFRNMGKVFEEIDDIVELGFNHLTVEDDVFTIHKERVIELCAYLIARYPHITWDCDVRVDTIDEEMISLMKNSNCKKIAFGVESGSPRMLKSIKKHITLDQIRNAFKLSRKYRIPNQAFFIVGYPDETFEDMKATERLIFEIKPDYLFLSVYVPYPGISGYEHMVNRNFLNSKNWDSFVFFGEKVPWKTRYFSGDELVKIRQRINRKFYFHPSYILRRIFSLGSIKELIYLVKGGLVACKSFLKFLIDFG